MTTQLLIDLDTDSPVTLSPERMSNDCCRLLVEELYLGTFETTPWQGEFLMDVFPFRTFTLEQKRVVYNLAFKFHIL